VFQGNRLTFVLYAVPSELQKPTRWKHKFHTNRCSQRRHNV